MLRASRSGQLRITRIGVDPLEALGFGQGRIRYHIDFKGKETTGRIDRISGTAGFSIRRGKLWNFFDFICKPAKPLF